MSLTEKALKLKLDAALATRVADFWGKAIAQHGETKAIAFYKSLGLNHLGSATKAAYEWEGLTLSREPTAAEKIAVKGIAGAQESSKEKITTILLKLRTQLISDGLKGIKKLDPATYHELTLQASAESRTSLRDRLIKVHKQGRMLVASELGKKEAVPVDDEFDDLDTYTDLTDGRVANDVQSRIIAAVQRFTLLGVAGAALIEAVSNEINAGSVSYIDRASQGLANKVINIGRSDEAQSRSGEWDRVEYSAILDQNVCEPCASEDGKTGKSEDDLQPAPNPECLGGDWCRCFHVWINQ